MTRDMFLPERVLIVAIILIVSGISVAAQTTSFNYQGRLQDGGTSANGNYDFQFTLWDALSGGTQQPQPSPVTVTRSAVTVANGVFTVQLDFGSAAFSGADRFLETSVKLSGAASFTVLSPRQPITATPYAVRSASAGSADVAATSANATQLGGVAANQYVITTDSRLMDPRAPTPGSSNYIQNTSSQQASSNFNVSGNGTVAGALSGGIVNATTQYNIAGTRVLSLSGGGDLANSNTFVGDSSGIADTPSTNAITGNMNSFFGGRAGASNSSGGANSFFGYIAGSFTTTGIGNSFYGQGAGRSSNGNSNSFFGASAGGNFFTTPSAGSRNSFFGANAGLNNNSGDDNTLLGYSANVASDNLSNATAIGTNAFVSQSNSLVLGSINGVNNAGADINVGIGTTAPAARLHIRGDASFANLLQLENTNASSARSFIIGPTAAGIFTIYDQNAFSTRVAIDYAGNVGIGTTAPVQRLDVVGNSTVSGNSNVGGALIAGTQGIPIFFNNPPPNPKLIVTGNSVVGGNSLFNTTGTNGVRITPTSDADIGVLNVTNAANSVNWLTVGNNGQVIMNGAGNVGIGTTSPDNKLTVNGAADKPGGGSWGTFSDERLKNLNGRFTRGLNAVMRLQPLRYEYKRDNPLGINSQGQHIGFSAQQVQKFIPEAVTANDKGYLLVNNDPIIWTMLNAIKEQQKEIEQLRKQVRQLRTSHRLGRR